MVVLQQQVAGLQTKQRRFIQDHVDLQENHRQLQLKQHGLLKKHVDVLEEHKEEKRKWEHLLQRLQQKRILVQKEHLVSKHLKAFDVKATFWKSLSLNVAHTYHEQLHIRNHFTY